MNLIVPEEDQQEFQVVGDCRELGAWKKSYNLTKCEKKNIDHIPQIKLIGMQKYNVYSLTFEIFRDKPKIHYYYIKRGSGCEIERHPGRKYELTNGTSSHPKCLKIEHKRGDTELF